MSEGVDPPQRPEESLGPLRVGTDVQLVASVAAALADHGDRYVRRLFTPHEMASVGLPEATWEQAAPGLAARYAAKEAVVKVLRQTTALALRDIEIRRHYSGWCSLRLRGEAERLATTAGLGSWAVSMSHDGGVALATVIAVEGRHGVARPADSRRYSDKMGRSEMEDQIRAVLDEQGRLPADAASLSPTDDLYRAGLTSHASVNVMLALEDTFDVEFPDELLRKATFDSIASIRQALESLGVAADAS